MNPWQGKIFICQNCGEEFISKKYCKSRVPKYCSSKCYGETLKLHIKCKCCGNEIENKNSVKLKNRIYCSKECQYNDRRGKPLSEAWRNALSEGRKKSEKCRGENLYNWKGGIENRRRHNIKRYHENRANGPLDKIYLRALLFLQRKKCFYCGRDISGVGEKAIEHLLPVSKGGTNDWMNLVYSCKSCNSQKKDTVFADFAIKKLRPDWMNNMVQFSAKKIAEIYATAKNKNNTISTQ